MSYQYPLLRRCLAAMACLLQLSACSPQIQNGGGTTRTPELVQDEAVMADGYRLPLKHWLPENRPLCRVVLALHGFNDFHMAFEALAGTLVGCCNAVYAYDQRGFGATEGRGLWPRERAWMPCTE